MQKNNVEMYMYKYILLVSEIIYYKRWGKPDFQLDFSDVCDYSNIINKVFVDECSVKYLCDAMDFLIKSEESKCIYDLADISTLLNDHIVKDSNNLTFSEKVYIFTCIDFCIAFGYGEEVLFKDYRRLAKKLIRGQRTLRPDWKKYFSNLDANNIGAFLSGFEDILSKLKTNKKIIDTLIDRDIKNITGISYLKHEIEKAIIINNSKHDSQSIQKQIEQFENNKYFKGMVHNVIDYESKKILLSYNDFEELMKQDYALILRAITSFELILEDRYNGVWNYFYIEKDKTQDNYYYQHPYYKKFLGFSPDIDKEEFGDILLTRDRGKISTGVQAFLKKYGEIRSSCPQKNADDVIKEITESNLINVVEPYKDQYYFVKYHEFISGKYNVYGRNSKYSIRKCLYNSYESGHYNPFYKAVSRIVNSDSAIRVTAKYTDIKVRDAKELNPITLSNGIKMFLHSYRYWKIINSENVPLNNEATKMMQNDYLIINDQDCIEVAVEFIKQL